jgi:hypothetical protein
LSRNIFPRGFPPAIRRRCVVGCGDNGADFVLIMYKTAALALEAWLELGNQCRAEAMRRRKPEET